MVRDWDLMREVLLEVEALDPAKHEHMRYGPASKSDEPEKDCQALILWRAGFVRGVDASSSDGDSVIAQELSWQGYDLLDTMRSKPVWEKIKSTSQEKGIELTFDSIKALGAAAIQWIITQT